MTEESFQSYKPAHTVDEVKTLTESVLGKKVTEMDRKDLGQINAVYFAALDDRTDCVVRISPKERNWNNFEEEAWAFEKCKAIGVPTPEVLAVDVAPSNFPEPFMITRRLSGVNGEEAHLSEEQKHKVLRQLGHYLFLIHSVQIDGFGRLQKQESAFVGEHISLWKSIQQEFDSGWWLAVVQENKLLPKGKVEEIKKRFDREEALFAVPTSASLIYGDASLKNLLVEGTKITGILDMENVSASDPVQDFAFFHFWISDAEGYFRSLQEGYDNQDLFDGNFRRKLLLYELLKALSTLAFRFQKSDPEEVKLVHRRIPEIEEELDSIQSGQ